MYNSKQDFAGRIAKSTTNHFFEIFEYFHTFSYYSQFTGSKNGCQELRNNTYPSFDSNTISFFKFINIYEFKKRWEEKI